MLKNSACRVFLRRQGNINARLEEGQYWKNKQKQESIEKERNAIREKIEQFLKVSNPTVINVELDTGGKHIVVFVKPK